MSLVGAEEAKSHKLHILVVTQQQKPQEIDELREVEQSPGLYEGYVYFAGEESRSFSYTDVVSGDQVSYSDGGDGKLVRESKKSLSVPEGGFYYLTADLNRNQWSATKVEWSIIGNATAGGWEKDSPMTYDAERKTWSITTDLKKAGSFKFRANKVWKLDFGVNEAADLEYSDNPILPYDAAAKDLTVHANGTYTVTLDLHEAGNYTYSIIWAGGSR